MGMINLFRTMLNLSPKETSPLDPCVVKIVADFCKNPQSYTLHQTLNGYPYFTKQIWSCVQDSLLVEINVTSCYDVVIRLLSNGIITSVEISPKYKEYEMVKGEFRRFLRSIADKKEAEKAEKIKSHNKCINDFLGSI